MIRLADLLAGGNETAETIARVKLDLLYDRGAVRDKYSRFFVMLALSSVIATGGIVADSAAVVVGAMIIAPLMTPMLAIALSTITGDGRNALRSLLLSVLGAGAVVAVAAAVTHLAPGGMHLVGNAQVATRTAPRIIDLIVALAAGAAGAIAVVRKDLAEVLPGVAVSISLVPPLCVAGTAFALGSPQLAYGALLLFTTNFFAIQLAGGLVFGLVGFSKAALSSAEPRARTIGIAVAVIGTLLCLVPLAATSAQLANAATLEDHAANAVGRWLEGSGFESLSVTSEDAVITVQITGRGTAPSTDSLASLLSTQVPRPSKVRVLILPQQSQVPLEPTLISAPTSEATVSVPAVETTSAVSPSPSRSTTPVPGEVVTQTP